MTQGFIVSVKGQSNQFTISIYNGRTGVASGNIIGGDEM
jgi:hypothetical protein